MRKKWSTPLLASWIIMGASSIVIVTAIVLALLEDS